ncbi:acetolactate synthase 2 small subunit [Shewanella surugensis]|uniref:Acetolactate synthase 2 small subunit n=1 Tax=Shewanella surugensis TaxID=212020 RepID=A0ABT0LDX7_9GAMM|nr:acetolactate synthase 2 small subunit [Shewanella surugensis]MCL1125893.1 acetolactate synthase 2 small subunit [Shewanella surugensis]
MIYDMMLTVHQRAEVLERVLRVIRHRGFKVTSINMQVHENETSMVDIVVESERAITLLSNQLTKLIDVVECQVLPSQIENKLASV